MFAVVSIDLLVTLIVLITSMLWFVLFGCSYRRIWFTCRCWCVWIVVYLWCDFDVCCLVVDYVTYMVGFADLQLVCGFLVFGLLVWVLLFAVICDFCFGV